MSHLEKPAVSRVRDALIKANQEDTIVEFADTARSADDAAKSVGCDLGAIVKSLVFSVDNRFVMALVAGDHKCIEDHLPNALKIKGRAAPASVRGQSHHGVYHWRRRASGSIKADSHGNRRIAEAVR